MKPVDNILATWATSKTALIADAMATCLFFVSNKLLLKDYDFEYLVLYADRSIEVSSKFPIELFKK